MSKSNIIIGDADVLIALVNASDIHHNKAMRISEEMSKENREVIFPSTTFVEAATTLRRKMNRPKAAATLIDYYQQQLLSIAFIDNKILEKALEIYNPSGSKKNTLFNAIVAATAKHYHTSYIFSFDTWYTKIGFQLYGIK